VHGKNIEDQHGAVDDADVEFTAEISQLIGGEGFVENDQIGLEVDDGFPNTVDHAPADEIGAVGRFTVLQKTGDFDPARGVGQSGQFVEAVFGFAFVSAAERGSDQDGPFGGLDFVPSAASKFHRTAENPMPARHVFPIRRFHGSPQITYITD